MSGQGAGNAQRRHKGMVQLHDKQTTIDWIGDIIKVVLIVVVILFCVSMSRDAYEVGYSIFYEEAVDEEGEGEEIEVTITEDMSVSQIGSMLEAYGLLLDGSVFEYQELFSSSHGQIVPGTYTLSTDMTPSEIISALAENYEEESEEEDASSEDTSTDESEESGETEESTGESEENSEETEDLTEESTEGSTEESESSEKTDESSEESGETDQ